MTAYERSGLQNERTALAWHRTALSLLAASLIITRLTYSRLGVVALLSLGLAAPFAVWVFLESRARYAGRRAGGTERTGVAALVVTAMTAVVGLTELLALTVQR